MRLTACYLTSCFPRGCWYLSHSIFFFPVSLFEFPACLYSAWLLGKSASLLISGNKTYPHTHSIQRDIPQWSPLTSFGWKSIFFSDILTMTSAFLLLLFLRMDMFHLSPLCRICYWWWDVFFGDSKYGFLYLNPIW